MNQHVPMDKDIHHNTRKVMLQAVAAESGVVKPSDAQDAARVARDFSTDTHEVIPRPGTRERDAARVAIEHTPERPQLQA